MLSDHQIKWAMAKKVGGLVIDPVPEDNCFQPASVDLRLSPVIRVYPDYEGPYIDLREPFDHTIKKIISEEGYTVEPGQFLLACTIERIELPADIVARVEGKSSLGRAGLMVHVTAGFVDPGWKGPLTLELKNVNTLPIVIYAGMKITQLAFEQIALPSRTYGDPALGSKYQSSQGPVGVR